MQDSGSDNSRRKGGWRFCCCCYCCCRCVVVVLAITIFGATLCRLVVSLKIVALTMQLHWTGLGHLGRDRLPLLILISGRMDLESIKTSGKVFCRGSGSSLRVDHEEHVREIRSKIGAINGDILGTDRKVRHIHVHTSGTVKANWL